MLTGVFPALERAFDSSVHKGALVLPTGYQTPAALSRRGRARLTAWLANRSVRDADAIAATAIAAARAQQTALPGEDVAAQILDDLARLWPDASRLPLPVGAARWRTCRVFARPCDRRLAHPR
ncbi:hypothetical protein SRO_7508 [Streptomyces rochei]|nr:hypothetical protein SRO_7508 [Streptomyces rochei]